MNRRPSVRAAGASSRWARGDGAVSLHPGDDEVVDLVAGPGEHHGAFEHRVAKACAPHATARRRARSELHVEPRKTIPLTASLPNQGPHGGLGAAL